jgi:plastocyanin
VKRLLAVAVAVGLLTACGASKPGSSSGGGASSSVAKGAPASVVVKNFDFTPGNLTVKTGTKVTWKFEDTTQHNVTADNKKFKSKDIQKGSYSYTFNSPGKYSYYCSIHQYMKGTVTVQ